MKTTVTHKKEIMEEPRTESNQIAIQNRNNEDDENDLRDKGWTLHLRCHPQRHHRQSSSFDKRVNCRCSHPSQGVTHSIAGKSLFCFFVVCFLSSTAHSPDDFPSLFSPSLMMSVEAVSMPASSSFPSFSSSSSPSSSFENETLSPRTVSTKYGSLRGVLVYFKTSSSSSSSGTKSALSGSGPGSISSSKQQFSSSSSSSSTSSSGSSPPSLQPVEVFLGVPYATPPIGSLRFMPPVTPTHWRGVRLANKFGPVCPQKFPDINLRPGSSRSKSSSGSGSTPVRTGGTRASSSTGSSTKPSFSFIPNNSYGSSSSSSSSYSSSSSSSSPHLLPESRIGHLKRMAGFLRNQSEDCLYLNIYAPYTSSSSSSTSGSPSSSSSSSSQSSSQNRGSKGLLPVMVFIHGDSYDWGSGNPFDGSVLSSFGNVLLITLNYRLGVFGFLPASLDGSGPRGNYGLMDQVAALHWIQENIAEFGGDPMNVTLVGHGYGAACVNLLMMSPMASSALFNRVILMSGSALSPWAVARDADSYAKLLAKSLNCPTYENVVMVDCLRSKSVDEILAVDLKVPEHLSAFGPIIDGIVIPSEPRSIISPANLETSSSSGGSFYSSYGYSSAGSSPAAQYNSASSSSPVSSLLPQSSSTGSGVTTPGVTSPAPYDVLFGITRYEAPPFIFSSQEEKSGIDAVRRDRILRTLVRNLFDYHQQVIFLTLINEYTDWSRPGEHPINLLDSLADIMGDALIVSPLIQTGDANVRAVLEAALHASSSRRHHHNDRQLLRSSSSPSSSSSLLSSQGTSAATSNIDTRTFFYVFSYNEPGSSSSFSGSSSSSSSSSSSQRNQGCQHGDELSYVFGAPLASDLLGRSLGHFLSNFSRQEINLSEAVMTYWTNFVKFGDPNIWPHELDSIGDRAKGRFENVYWPQYDSLQRKYLMIGMKPKVRDHYHSHRLSYWLHLVPRLQMQQHFQQQHQLLQQTSQQLESMGGESYSASSSSSSSLEADDQQQVYYFKHHLLPDHENLDSYDGVVRQISFRFSSSPSSSSGMNVINSTTKEGLRSSTRIESSSRGSSASLNLGNTATSLTGKNNVEQSVSSSSSSVRPDSFNPALSGSSSTSNRSAQATAMITTIHEQGQGFPTMYLLIFLGGATLLLVNIMVLAGVWYFMKKGRSSDKIASSNSPQGNQSNDLIQVDSNGVVVSSESSRNLSATLRRGHHHHLHHHQHQHHSPRQLNQFQFQEVLPLTQEEVIMLSQKESLVSGNPYGSLDKNNSIVTSSTGVNNGRGEGLILPTDLDLYTSHALASHLHQHHDHQQQHYHHNHLNSQAVSQSGLTGVTTSSSAASSGTTTSSSHPHHVHFLTHHNQVEILDSSDSLLDPSIMTTVTASGGNNHTNTTSTLTRNTQYLRS